MTRFFRNTRGGNRAVHLGVFDNGGMRKMYLNSDELGGAGPVAINGTLTAGGGIDATGGLSASQLSSGTVPIARMPTSGFDASWLTAGTLALARLSGISTSQLAADSVDDTIVGNRVPQIYRRQGGSASDWSIAGTTSYTPAMVRMQAGVTPLSGSASPQTITFPVAFSAAPIVVAIANIHNWKIRSCL